MAALADIDIERDTVLMMEVTEEGEYVAHHKQQIVLVLSAMRHFAEERKRAAVFFIQEKLQHFHDLDQLRRD